MWNHLDIMVLHSNASGMIPKWFSETVLKPYVYMLEKTLKM